ncbi:MULTISPECIES: hypothetical protein [unclassified Fusibacter]|nr:MULTISPECIES: hypothetical protein [unclassified Fusibacter]MCK8059642.1 hypothetical protein [Fusibacter sp. A2]NPE21443.1 hypothetical protein [Fusibacter sp. A1]
MFTTPQPKVPTTLSKTSENEKEIQRLVNNDVTNDVPYFDSINIAKLS